MFWVALVQPGRGGERQARQAGSGCDAATLIAREMKMLPPHDLSAPCLPLLWKGELVCPGLSGSNGRGADGRGGMGVGESGRFFAQDDSPRYQALHVHGDDIFVLLQVENALRGVSKLEINGKGDENAVAEGGAKARGAGGRFRERGGGTLTERCTKAKSESKLIECVLWTDPAALTWLDGLYEVYEVNLPADAGVCAAVVPQQSVLHAKLIHGRPEPLLVFWATVI